MFWSRLRYHLLFYMFDYCLLRPWHNRCLLIVFKPDDVESLLCTLFECYARNIFITAYATDR